MTLAGMLRKLYSLPAVGRRKPFYESLPSFDPFDGAKPRL